MKLRLIQSADLFGPPERQAELQKVWRINATLFEHITNPAGRPSFADLFNMCLPGTVNVIGNADIYYDSVSLSIVLKYYAKEENRRTIMALSRYDIRPDGQAYLYDRSDSQDSWIVYGGPHEVPADFPMGRPGCDNSLMHILRANGWKVINPSRTIRSYHLHQTDYRSYLVDNNGQPRGRNKIDRVAPPYALERPRNL